MMELKKQKSDSTISNIKKGEAVAKYEFNIDIKLSIFFKKYYAFAFENLIVRKNLKFYSNDHKNEFESLKDHLQNSSWKDLQHNLNDLINFHEIEYDLIFEIDLKDEKQIISIPYQLKDSEKQFDENSGLNFLIDPKNKTKIFFILEITKNPEDFRKKVWQMEKIIGLTKIFADCKQKFPYSNDDERNFVSNLSNATIYYGLVCNGSENAWISNVAGNLVNFFSFQKLGDISEDIAKEELKNIRINILKNLVSFNLEEFIEDANSLKKAQKIFRQTYFCKELENKSLLLFHCSASLDDVINYFINQETKSKEQDLKIKEQDLKIKGKEQDLKIIGLIQLIEDLKIKEQDLKIKGLIQLIEGLQNEINELNKKLNKNKK